jgi:undecaprenyl-diphosphatase
MMGDKEMTEVQVEMEKEQVKSRSYKKWQRLTLLIICGIFFLWSFQQIVLENVIGFDEAIRTAINAWGAEWLVSFFHLFTMLGDKRGVIIIMLLALAVIWWKTRDYTAMGVLAAGVILVNEGNKWLKDFTGRERPMTGPGAESLSFPSGHAMVGLFFYGLLIYYLLTYTKKKNLRFIITIFGAIFIAVLGTSRIFLNYHYPSDVFAGYAAGYICLILGVLSYEWIHPSIKKKAM